MRISDWSSDVCSSDLRHGSSKPARACVGIARAQRHEPSYPYGALCGRPDCAPMVGSPSLTPVGARPRSEEHTSELQTLMRISYAVFCLKKKKQLTNKH